MLIRRARAADYDAVAAVVDQWWGRPVVTSLPRLFLEHFADTSWVAVDADGLAGFLIGFHSPAQPASAYIHFAAVRPDCRRRGVARRLYGEFITAAVAAGRPVVTAVTSPGNERSVAFHRGLGFAVAGPVADYHGPGRDMVTFTLRGDRPSHTGGT